MKPIQTYYNGHHFRSRLEARWAVFFDAAGIEYRYEPEGIELDDGRRWLPDFHLLLGRHFWLVEVKGVPQELDIPLLTQALEETKRAATRLENCPVGVLVLGDAPPLKDGERALHGAILGKKLRWITFTDPHAAAIYDPKDSPPTTATDLVRGRVLTDSRFRDPRIRGAYHKARAARFEFGETPKAARS